MEKISIKPAARMISAIGKDLIKDVPASVVEIIKNSYDADAENVNISFSKIIIDNCPTLQIVIEDDGHGMDLDTIKTKWFVPATSNKLNQKYSTLKNRALQGRKGLGRYAVAVLGNKLTLETTHNNEKTIVRLDWDEFDNQVYLEDVLIELDTFETDDPNGTRIIIHGQENYVDMWNEKEFKKLIKELSKLLSPLPSSFHDDIFNISLKTNNFIEDSIYENRSITIEPFPLLEMYNYRLSGEIDESGVVNISYENNSLSTRQVEQISTFKIELDETNEKYCGKIKLDLRIYDLDTPNIETLRTKLSRDSDQTFSKRETSKLLKEITGVGIYRGGFRIRPHGDKGFDWLELDSLRVQNPSMRIGSNQIIGFVSIEPEERSNLEEKSARDGLKDNVYFEGLKKQTLEALKKLEAKRFAFRRSSEKPKSNDIFQKVDNLFDFDTLQQSLNTKIEKTIEISELKDKEDLTQELMHNIKTEITKMRADKEKDYQDIKNIISLYQGQATLGNITSVVLHEGRRSVSWFSNAIPRVVEWLYEYKEAKNKETKDNELLMLSIDRLQTANIETQNLIHLFDKLEPLTTIKKEKSKVLKLDQYITNIEKLFESKLSDSNISLLREYDERLTLKGTERDFNLVFTNLIENSIYWLEQNSDNINKVIVISSFIEDEELIIDIIDNGIGIEKEFIEKDIIFNPGFSNKSSGTGLGLAISGEALKRNGGTLKAIYNENGAHFRLVLGRSI
ncbi:MULTISPECIES: ATP-binding protein [unclassified Exiguobacterium]|uniref:ATP-binding protein n=1 Tax=unclassified Exiguobacterium TaxID=2644629 RepID=UPI001BE9A73F|nr:MULTISPECIES: ATP-binding protein [unclassified Exiguobacterium]